MRADFQEEILKFVLQTKEGKKFRSYLEKELWDVPVNQVVFDAYANYVDTFSGVPSKVTLMEFIDRELKKKKGEKISKEVYQAIEKQVYHLYEPFQEDASLIRTSIIEFAQRKKTKNLFRDNVDKVRDGDENFFRSLFSDMSKIVKLTDDQEDVEKNRSGFLLQGAAKLSFNHNEGTPTFLKALNRMTASGGFKTPELVIFMGAPKSFKTGTLLKLCIEMVRDGKKVYYADTENGINAIRNRFFQGLMECERYELEGLKKSGEVDEMAKRVAGMGGDLQVGFFPANSKTLDDVDAELEYLRDEFNWIPDIIAYDYLDLFKSGDKKITENRFRIQSVYHHAVRLNNKWDTFALSISTVGKAAVNKAVINMKDFGEDFAKAYNCHAAFAICRTEEEMELGYARIIPVAQREGVPYRGTNTCMVKIDEARMIIEETEMTEITKTIRTRKGVINDD